MVDGDQQTFDRSVTNGENQQRKPVQCQPERPPVRPGALLLATSSPDNQPGQGQLNDRPGNGKRRGIDAGENE